MEDKKASFLRKLVIPGGSTGMPSTVLEYENEDELREAVENFRAYLMILREWDAEERMERARRVVESA